MIKVLSRSFAFRRVKLNLKRSHLQAHLHIIYQTTHLWNIVK